MATPLLFHQTPASERIDPHSHQNVYKAEEKAIEMDQVGCAISTELTEEIYQEIDQHQHRSPHGDYSEHIYHSRRKEHGKEKHYSIKGS